MTQNGTASGECKPGYEAVRQEFQRNFDERGDDGAQVCVVKDGEVVVDLWGGSFQQDTLVNVWSTTKGMVAVCAHLLVQQGELDVDAPVSSYWPEFKQAGKEAMPVRHLLSHRSGLSGWEEPVTYEDIYDWEKSTSLLAAQAPWWEPGTQSGYHALTFGHLVGEVIRRITGQMPGEFFRTQIAEPLGVDFHIGLTDQDLDRVADVVMPPPPAGSDPLAIMEQLGDVARKTIANPVATADTANTEAWRRAEIPAANGHGTARALATVYSKVATGELLTRETVDRAREMQGPPGDLVLGVFAPEADVRIALGFWRSGDVGLFGPNAAAFGHDGYGGSFGMADPEAGIGMAWTMNVMGFTLVGDPRKTALIDAVYRSIG